MGTIRPARTEDAAACVALYNYYIANTTVTMELATLTEETFRQRMETIGQRYPWYVYEEEGELLGYGYLSAFHERAAFRFTCDLSLYVAKQARGRGIGTALLAALEARAKALGFCSMMSLVTTENEKSAAFHSKHGFVKVAEIPHVAFKFKRWMGLCYYQKQLLAREDPEAYER